MDNPAVKNYVNFFEGSLQHGGGADFPVFMGSRNYQAGNGLGDVLKSAWRWFFPVVTRGAASFMKSAAGGLDSGGGWREAAKSAIAPAVTGMLAQTAEQVADAAAARVKKQSGEGGKRKRKHKSKQYKRAKSKDAKFTHWNF